MGPTGRPTPPRTDPDDRTADVDVPDGLVRTRRDGSSAVIDVTGTFPADAGVANTHLLRALSTDPTTVTCDLTGVTGAVDEQVLGELLETGGLLEHWPGTAVVLVTQPSEVQRVERLLLARYADRRPVHVSGVAPTRRRPTAHPGTGREAAVRPRAQIHLEPHTRIGRTARDFVSRTCLDWQLTHVIGAAALVVSELVTNGLARDGAALDVTVSTADGRLLLGVHDGSDQGPGVPTRLPASSRSHGLHLVAGFSRAWGSLPREGGGTVVWAVLDT
jgi:hypothetical protein